MVKIKGKRFISLVLVLILCIHTFMSWMITCSPVKAYVNKLNNPRVEFNTMDCIYFGSYWQEDTNGDGVADKNDAKTPVRWRILSREGNKVFLLSEEAIECMPYNNSENEDIIWENCSLRKWLNNDFYENAFNDDEKQAIKETVVENYMYTLKGTVRNYDTLDKIYLLSKNEILNPDYGFKNSSSILSMTRKVKATDYIKEKCGNYINDEGYVKWYLRTPMFGCADTVGPEGLLSRDNADNLLAVRPALWVDLSVFPCEIAGMAELGIARSEWDVVYFGNYWQEDTNGDGVSDKNDDKTPISWRVLSVNGNDVFLMSDKILDYYNEEIAVDIEKGWEKSSIREWLNKDFYNEAFNKDDRKSIKETNVINTDENNTKDRIYLMSAEEAVNTGYGFLGCRTAETDTRSARHTEYTKSIFGEDDFYMLLRTKSNYKCTNKGMVRQCNIWNNSYAIRPVLHIDISFCNIKKAGTVQASDYSIKDNYSIPEADAEPTGLPAQEELSKWGINNPQTTLETVDCIYFGNYWQEDINADGRTNKRDIKTPIKWKIIDIDGNDAFLISDKILSVNKYSEKKDVKWKDSLLYKWIKYEFYNDAFSYSEREAIIGNQASILSVSDIEKYIKLRRDNAYGDKIYTSEIFESEATKYVKENNYSLYYKFWVRPYESSTGAYIMQPYKTSYVREAYENDQYGIRPVIHVDLSKIEYEDAGTIEAGIECSSWDCIYFGNYAQEEDGEKKPIKWRVLSVDGNDACIMADSVLAERQYNNTEDEDVTWETCSLRKWLNNDFYNEAFNSSEKAAITETKVKTEVYESMEKIYLLSGEEAVNIKYGFDKNNQDTNTRIASDGSISINPGEIWWLRFYDSDSNDVLRAVDKDGYLIPNDYYIPYKMTDEYGVRPVLHIDLSKSVWEKAKSVKAGDYYINDSVTMPKVTYTESDVVYFGNYRYSDTNDDYKIDEEDEPQPIKWRVLKEDGDDIFLMSESTVASRVYHEKDEDVTWETCSLRKWLNDEFYNDAFNNIEKQAIKYTHVVNEDNPIYGTDGGNDTIDKVYLLSIQELTNEDYGFSPNIYSDQRRYIDVSWSYWTRTPGRSGTENADVYYGEIEIDAGINNIERHVHPVIHIDKSVFPLERGETMKTGIKQSEWDSIYFGNYWQDDTNKDGRADTEDKKTPIRWRVLSVNGDIACLISDTGLGCAEEETEEWQDSNIRKWLNNDFYNEAFNSKEKEAIVINKMFGTIDKVKILSWQYLYQDNYGFADTAYSAATCTRTCKGSDYAKQSGIYVSDTGPWAGNSMWWVMAYKWDRIPVDGNMNYRMFCDNKGLIRPVIYINLESDTYSHAGKIRVSNTDIMKEVPFPTPVPDSEKSQPRQKKPWQQGAFSCDVVSDPVWYGILNNNTDEIVTLYTPETTHVKGYYRWLELAYDGLDETYGLILYDAYGARYDLGTGLFKDYEGTAVCNIDLYSLTGWEEYLSRIDIYATVSKSGMEFADMYSYFGFDYIKLYSDKDYALPTPTPGATKKPLPTRRPYATAVPHTIKSPLPSENPPVVSFQPENKSVQKFQLENDAVLPSPDITPPLTENNKRLLSKPTFTLKKKREGAIKYIEIKLKKYDGEYIQVYVKNEKKHFKKVSVGKVKIKKYKRIFKIQYNKRKQKVQIKVRTYRIKGKKKIYSRYSSVKKIVT